MDSNSLLIFDTNYILRRHWERCPSEQHEVERARAACRATMNTIRSRLGATYCTHAVAVFDPPGRNWRHEIFPEYKATRPDRPPALVALQPALKQQIELRLAMRCMEPSYSEADDLIDHLVTEFLKRPESLVRLMTADKDLAVLINDSVEMVDPFSGEVRSTGWVREKFGVRPDQIQDFLALVGDRSDNVPGVPGIGPKKAAHLLGRHGNLDAMLAADDPDASVVAANRESALLSRQLVAFRCPQVPYLSWDLHVRPMLAPRTTPPFAPMEARL